MCGVARAAPTWASAVAAPADGPMDTGTAAERSAAAAASTTLTLDLIVPIVGTGARHWEGVIRTIGTSGPRRRRAPRGPTRQLTHRQNRGYTPLHGRTADDHLRRRPHRRAPVSYT